QILDNSDSYDGIYITSACTIDVFDLLKDLKKGSCPYLVTTDLFVENRYLLKKQTCTATIFQDPYQQGKKSVNRLYQYLCGQKIEHKLLVTPQLVFPSNEPFVAK
ncbi:MAG: substrate-binding domain-containing protein, partial [Clostridia bacterium]|nr:substrate-binding domain-containing protein [Clostridia bacterium]